MAVHPSDSRYQHLHGCKLRHPVTQHDIPLILDSCVDRELGTGALKVTPGNLLWWFASIFVIVGFTYCPSPPLLPIAHDATDHEIGARHGLPAPVIFTKDGNMSNRSDHSLEVQRPAFHFAMLLNFVLLVVLCLFHSPLVPTALQGLHRMVARSKIISLLEEQGSLRQIRPHAMVSIGCLGQLIILPHFTGSSGFFGADVRATSILQVIPICSRSGDVVEPLLSPQWFIDCQKMAQV